MHDWYTQFYEKTKTSKIHAMFCERLYGKNFCQHGFMDMQQLEQLLGVARLDSWNNILELGCGNGYIAEYISDVTQCHITGIDYIQKAIQQAEERTRAKRDRLTFMCGDMREVDFSPGSFNTILSIDTIYFYEDLRKAIQKIRRWITDRGQFLIFYSYSLKEDSESSDGTLLPKKTPLGVALTQNGLRVMSWDLTQQDYQHQRLKKRLAEKFRPMFEAEGIRFIYENRIAEANGYTAAFESGRHCRYLYRATL